LKCNEIQPLLAHTLLTFFLRCKRFLWHFYVLTI
jgi:hypothetical protein